MMKVTLDYTGDYELITIDVQNCRTQKRANQIVALINMFIPIKKSMKFILNYDLDEDLEKGIHFFSSTLFKFSRVQMIKITCLNRFKRVTRIYTRDPPGDKKVLPIIPKVKVTQ